MTTEMVQAAQTAAAPANGTSAKAAAKDGKDAKETAAANGAPKAETPAPDGTTPTENGNTENAAPEPTPEDKEAAELRKKEDEIAAKGAEIAGVRALLARAFNKPSEEPARGKTHWTLLLEEMSWLAVDYSQERLWKQTSALAVAFEIAKKKGDFGLKQPPKEFREFSDEIRELRTAAAKAEGAAPAPTGRRSSARKADASAGPSPAAFLGLDPATDPIFADIELGEGLVPGTPPSEEAITAALAFPCDEEFAEKLEKSLMTSEVDRIIQEEVAYRSYRLEYEASVVSHQLAVQEQLAAANNIGDLGLGPVFGAEAEEPDAFATTTKKAGKRRKGGARSSGGFLGLDDYGEEDEYAGAGTKRSASKAALVEDVYLRKKRPTRTPAYREVDADYDLAQETGTRYSTRRATGALARNQQRAQQERGRRGAAGGRADQYQQQQAARARAQAGLPGMMLWTKSEDDLLLAVVHEFGVNWTLVSEVLSLSLGMQGIHRPPPQCRQRFRHLTMQEGHDYSEERAYAALAQQLSKQQARELLVASLPVRDDALVRLLEALVQVGASANTRRAMEERKNENIRTRRQEMHQSYLTIVNNLMAQTGNRHLSPLDLCNTVNNAYIAQARQQALLAQQQAAMQAQHAAAMAAQGGGPPGGQPPPGQQPGAPGQQPMQPGAPGQQPGVTQGTPGGQQPLGMPSGTPPGPGSLPSQGSLPAPGKPHQVGTPPPPQVTLQQLNTILTTNKLPNGQELDEKMRKAIEAKRAAFVQQIQQQQQSAAAAAAQRQQALAQGGQPGAAGAPPAPAAVAAAGPSAASIAAMQASQHAAQMQNVAAGRPPLPPGMYGMPPGQPMQLPPGVPGIVQLPQGAVLSAPPAPGGMPGVVMPPNAQHQLLAQQMMQQQQQAAAAAAAQQQAQQK